jgi:hypothetical protein
LKKLNCEKKLIKLIKILKNWPVQFGFSFISLKLKKPNPNRKKTESNLKKPNLTKKIKSNQFASVFILKNQTKPKLISLNRFRLGFNFFFFFKFNCKYNQKNDMETSIIASILKHVVRFCVRLLQVFRSCRNGAKKILNVTL